MEEKEFKIYGQEKEVQYLSQIYRNMGIFLAERLVKTEITPNFITFLAIFFGFVSIGTLLFFKNNLGIIIGVAIFQLSLILDVTDGSLARRKNIINKFITWMDYNADVFLDTCVLFAVTLSLYLQTKEPLILIFGFSTIIMKDLIYNISIALAATVKEPSKILEKGQKNFLSNFIPTRPFIFLSLMIFAIFNKVYLYFVLMTIYQVFFYFGTLAYLSIKLKKNE